ncbi:MAG: adenylosuccinate lyase [Candidatus Aminicenantes bacterium]|nr:adenylosuccinate lyase [Candidatus Aminicenantes bacterium]
MIKRYSLPEMIKVWSEENKFRRWLEVELAVCEAWAELGKIPPSSLENIKKKAAFSVERIEAIEKKVKHDVIAFLNNVAEYVGEDARYIHLGLTSYDIVDTALSLLLVESLDIIIQKVSKLREVIKNQALEHKKTLIAGRTHGVHAEPITFGVKLLVWYEEMGRHLRRLNQAREVIRVGRISGSVGTYIHLDPRVEEIALTKLGLIPAKVSNQVLQRDRHAEVLFVLALIATTLEKIAIEIRHLQRTEVQEVEEPFTPGQKGSSSMPHKKNPVRAERISGLARVIRSYLFTALENIPLWHERDISHSSAERIIFPDAFTLIDFILHETIDLISHWTVYKERMASNVFLTRGLVFSQAVMLALTEKGMNREEAYEVVQKLSLRCLEEKTNFKELVLEEKAIRERLSVEEIEACFRLEPYLEKIDFIFERVLGNES